MALKVIGAVMIVLGCGGFGFRAAASQKHTEYLLRKLINVLDYMMCELQYKMTPLPQLCQQAAGECSGILSNVFTDLASELLKQTAPDPQTCMQAVLDRRHGLPEMLLELLWELGHSFGQFHLEGQLKGIESIRNACIRALSGITENKENRLRTYQTLGLCAGAALVILFI